MTVLGENPGEEIIVSEYVADAGGAAYDWFTGLAKVNVVSVASDANPCIVHIDGIAATVVDVDASANGHPLHLIATGW